MLTSDSREAPIPVIQPTASHTAVAAPIAPRPGRVALWIFLASATICILAYLALTVQGPWFGSANTLHWTPRDLSVTEGSAQSRPDGLAVRPADALRPVRIAVATSLRAIDYPVIAWETSGVPDDAEVAVLWQNDQEPGRVFNQRVDVEAGRVQPLSLGQNRKWAGRIAGIALAVRGNFSDPMVVRGATAKTMSPREVLGDRVREWFKFEPWNGSSINTLIGAQTPRTCRCHSRLQSLSRLPRSSTSRSRAGARNGSESGARPLSGRCFWGHGLQSTHDGCGTSPGR